MRRPHWRKMTWVLLVWTGVMFVWMIAGGVSAGSECNDLVSEAEQVGCVAGTGIGVAGLFILWFLGFIVLGLIWFMTRPKGRECPACGETVKKRRTTCASCGFDLAAAARGAAQPAIESAPDE